METNKIINGDNVEVLKTFPKSCIDLVVTSPPYDKARKYKGFTLDFEQLAHQIYRVLKNGGVNVWIAGDQTVNGSESLTSFNQALYFVNEVGFRLHDTMIYQKEGLTMNHNRYEQEFEYMFVFSKGKPKTWNPIMIPCKWYGKDNDRTGQFNSTHKEHGKKHRSGKERKNVKQYKIKGNIWKYNTGYGHSTSDEIAFEHPAIMPEKLARDHIKTWSNEGDIVLDPFVGSGTVPKMAYLLNRRYIGIDISLEYCELSEKRILLTKQNLGTLAVDDIDSEIINEPLQLGLFND